MVCFAKRQLLLISILLSLCRWFQRALCFSAVTDSSEEPSDDSSASVMFHLSPSSLLFFGALMCFVFLLYTYAFV